MNLRTIPTGCAELDQNTTGGFPRGKLTDLYGEAAEGQARIILGLIAKAQQKGLLCAYVDGGRGIDLAAARAAGVDLTSLLVCQPASVEEATDLALTIVQTRQVGLVVVDSLNLLPIRDGSDPESHEGVRYRSQLAVRTTGAIYRAAGLTGCAVVFSARSVDRGAQDNSSFGSNALRFYADLRVEVSSPSGTNGIAVAKVRKHKRAPYRPDNQAMVG